jgi:phosphatidylcholine synthase
MPRITDAPDGEKEMSSLSGGRAIAWAVHVLTASGVVIALLSLLAVLEGHPQAALLWLGLALAVDGLDGPLARRFEVKKRLPRFDGAVLDLVVDYLTYVVVPAIFLYRFGFFPDAFAVPVAAFIMATSLYIFANADMKTSDNYFVGFPAIWNVVALYVYVLDPPKAATLAATAILGLASFSTAKFLHPLRVREGRTVTLVATAVWSLASFILVVAQPERPVLALAAWLLASAWLAVQSLRRTLRGPGQPLPAE